jgi:hypothetical protein
MRFWPFQTAFVLVWVKCYLDAFPAQRSAPESSSLIFSCADHFYRKGIGMEIVQILSDGGA